MATTPWYRDEDDRRPVVVFGNLASSALAPMAASTAAMLASLTPCRPSACRLAAVSAGLGAWPAARFSTPR